MGVYLFCGCVGVRKMCISIVLDFWVFRVLIFLDLVVLNFGILFCFFIFDLLVNVLNISFFVCFLID